MTDYVPSNMAERLIKDMRTKMLLKDDSDVHAHALAMTDQILRSAEKGKLLIEIDVNTMELGALLVPAGYRHLKETFDENKDKL